LVCIVQAAADPDDMVAPSDSPPPGEVDSYDLVPQRLPQAVAELTPGVVIAGRYRVEHRIGGGSMGEVWAGEHIGLGVRVAIKTLPFSASTDHQTIARFRREALLLGRIRSDSVARVLDFVCDEAYGLVLVMEFVVGQALSDVLSGDGRLSIEEAIDIGAALATGLCDLHRAHVVHRDLKPANVILEHGNARKRRAVLVDFGASRMVSASDGLSLDDTMTAITCAGMAIGTIEYMAPEQLLSSRDVTPASDVYALGAVLFRAVAGQHVHGKISQGALVRAKLCDDAPALDVGRDDAVATAFADIIARALRRHAAERYATAMPMAEALSALRDLARGVESERPSHDDVDELPFPLVRPRVKRVVPPALPSWYRKGA
jgi:serine/threonine-protein kinase